MMDGFRSVADHCTFSDLGYTGLPFTPRTAGKRETRISRFVW
jgi:hypothetical protein